MIAATWAAQLQGAEAEIVKVETVSSPGLPIIELIGISALTGRGTRNRVRTALKSLGYRLPSRRVTVNLAPVEHQKKGSQFDLSIALTMLVATQQIQIRKPLEKVLFHAELGLDGSLRPVHGTLPVLAACADKGIGEVVLAAESRHQASLWSDQNIRIHYFARLNEVVAWLTDDVQPADTATRMDPEVYWPEVRATVDLREIRGQHAARRALEIAAAGGHHLLMAGPPGLGKTMLAQSMAGILPPVSPEERIQLTAIYNAAGLMPNDRVWGYDRPFRAPHIGCSRTQLTGGAVNRLGEISLAHAGVLFLDELPEFDRKVLEALRTPLENGTFQSKLAGRWLLVPANFQLVAAMNLCPCSRMGLPEDDSPCVCTPREIRRYRQRVSHAFLDRIDIRVSVPALKANELLEERTEGESSEAVRSRVTRARTLQAERGVLNRWLRGSQLRSVCSLNARQKQFMEDAFRRFNLSGRAYDGVLRVARTIADLEEEKEVQYEHLAEAISYRLLA